MATYIWGGKISLPIGNDRWQSVENGWKYSGIGAYSIILYKNTEAKTIIRNKFYFKIFYDNEIKWGIYFSL